MASSVAAIEEIRPNVDRRRGGRRRTPTILQMEATECGAAALAMVLGHYGRFVPLERLRVECGVSRDGSKANNILRAAREHGLIAKGYRREPKVLFDLPFPMIVFWNFNHFVVVEGGRGDRMFLNDPASGPRIVSFEEFDLSFTGVCLAFQPGPGFVRGGKQTSVLRGLWERLGISRTALAFVILATLALVVPGLVVPVFTGIFVDEVLIRGSQTWLLPLAVGMLLTASLRAALTWLQQWFLARLEIKLSLTSSAKFFWHVLRLPVEFFGQRYVGDISNRVSANDKVAQLITSELATSAINLITIGFYAAVMVTYDPLLTVVGVGLAFINLGALAALGRLREDASRRMLKEQGGLVGTSVNGVQLIETLKATGREGDFFSKWAGHQSNMLAAQQALGFYSHILNVIPALVTALSTVTILGLGGYRVYTGAITIGGLVAFQGLMQNFARPIEGLVRLGGSLQQMKGEIARLDDVLHYQRDRQFADSEQEADQAPAIGPSFRKLSGEIILDNVAFGYSRREPPLIGGLDLIIKPGMRVALVGGSGSGKSTIGRLLCGLHEPWSGEILFDGHRIGEIPRDVFAQSIAYVDQDITLFEGSVRDNISLWNRTVPEVDIIRALRDACMHDDIAARHQKYDAHIEEGGANLSGGQRQRLEIARALVNNPSILVLDEATAALDSITEQQIDDHIRIRGCTCVIIAHRLSTIRDADEIVVLERGQVVQRGVHDEMIGVDGPYRQLITAE